MNTLRYLYKYFRDIIIQIMPIIRGKKLEELDKVLIISPHPDDEILGCGGFISYMVQHHKAISIIYMTKGENVDKRIPSDIVKVERTKLAKRALSCVGQSLNHVYFLDFTDGKINMEDPETGKLNALINQISPRVIFVTHRMEKWNDHIQSNNIMHKLIQDHTIKFYEYCVWTWSLTPFQDIITIKWHNARYFKMGKDIHKLKKKAIKIYMDETNVEGLPYSGALPPDLLRSCSWREEIFFESKPSS
ncbi:MAG: PIG-L family deacetylase [Bacteroidales bacterium]|nr:PIG-L family deacetylase [Bacteroidales bacterium]